MGALEISVFLEQEPDDKYLLFKIADALKGIGVIGQSIQMYWNAESQPDLCVAVKSRLNSRLLNESAKIQSGI